MKNKNSKIIGVSVQTDDIELIDSVAKKLRVSRSAFVKIAAFKLVDEINNSPEKFVTLTKNQTL